MRLVIDIPEDRYETLKMLSETRTFYLDFYQRLIVNGTPLPKGHGRLVDEHEVASLKLCKDISCSECPFNKNGCGIAIYVEGCKTIIEADKEGVEG